ncbi:MAG: dienelactone hydrolase family protein [Oscillospiraceae bacterium]
MDATSNLEQLNPVLRAHRQRRHLRFEEGRWSDLEQWKSLGKGAVMELLRYSPTPTPLNPQVHSSEQRDGYRMEKISFDSGGLRVPGYLLIPDGEGPFSAVAALHDHGGFYYWGKEKIVDTGIRSGNLDAFLERGFEGTYWATELVTKGYVVLVIDAFYFGERKLRLEDVPEYALAEVGLSRAGLEKLEEGSEEYIAEYNKLAVRFEVAIERYFRFAGIEWPGILAYDDRTGIDYLCSRPEVDSGRIGCCGLSLGGFRSAMLTALDTRIKCGVVAGWMVSYNSLLPLHSTIHTHMVSIHGLPDVMDLPDMLGLGCPTPLMVMQCEKDHLFTVEGMQEACDHLGEIYRSAGAAENFRYGFYNHGHQFCRVMQAEATAWLDRWLKG